MLCLVRKHLHFGKPWVLRCSLPLNHNARKFIVVFRCCDMCVTLRKNKVTYFAGIKIECVLILQFCVTSTEISKLSNVFFLLVTCLFSYHEKGIKGL